MLLCPFSNFSTVVSHGVGVALLSFKKRETDAAIEETKLIAMQHRGGGRCCYIRAGFPCSLSRSHPLFEAPCLQLRLVACLSPPFLLVSTQWFFILSFYFPPPEIKVFTLVVGTALPTGCRTTPSGSCAIPPVQICSGRN